MNMTLDGIEAEINRRFGHNTPERHKHGLYTIRYADDFVVLGRTREILIEVKQVLTDFLQTRGLSLSKEKTCITHINDGFNFLGMNLRKYQEKLIIKPTKEKVKRFLQKIQETI